MEIFLFSLFFSQIMSDSNLIVVTGAAGFIGSNIVKGLNERGYDNILAVDNLKRSDKFINLLDCQIYDYIDKNEFLDRLQSNYFANEIHSIFHQGACSDTMETDGFYMMENNFRYSQYLLQYCIEEEISLIYASSAATYGAAEQNMFVEDPQYEKPLNVYGYSKYLFDQIVRRELAKDLDSQVVGCRYFNVYGYGEFHKGRMASVALHNYYEFCKNGYVELFEGGTFKGIEYANGGHLRDFVYIKDVVDINLYFWENPQISGIFNVGTGNAEPFNEIAKAVINTIRKEQQNLPPLSLAEMVEQNLLRYKKFPEALLGKYQAYTQADITKLQEQAHYLKDFYSVEKGVKDYVKQLIKNKI